MQESISNGDQMPPVFPAPANDLSTIKSKSTREAVRPQNKEMFKFWQIARRHYHINLNVDSRLAGLTCAAC